MLYWALPGATFICAVAQPFFTAWAGPQFGRESTLPLYLLMGGVIFEIMSYVPYALLLALGRTDTIARSLLWLVIPYLFASALLIHRFGAAGAAAAWSLRTLTSVSVFSWFARRSTGFRFAPWPENTTQLPAHHRRSRPACDPDRPSEDVVDRADRRRLRLASPSTAC